MSSRYYLEVLRAEGIIWGSGHMSKAPNLYIKVMLGNEERKTRIKERTASPQWNESFTFEVPDSSQATDLSVKLNHKPALLPRTCIGVATVKLETLLEAAQGEVKLALLRVGSSEVAATVHLRLKVVDERQQAVSELNSAGKDIEQLRTVNPAIAEGQATIGQVAAQVDGNKDLIRSLGSLLGKIQVFKELVDKVAAVHPYANAAWQVTTCLYEAVQQQIEADQKVAELIHLMEDILDYTNHIDSIRDKIKPIQSKIIEFLRQTTECCLFIRQYTRAGFIGRMLDLSGQKQKVDDFVARFNDLREALVRGTALQTTFVSARLSEKVDVMYLRDELAPITMDASNRPECLPGTRSEQLSSIMGWLFSDMQQNILWLHGVAGSGKSTISMTISEMCLSMGRRGAYLFFTRGKSDPSMVIRTIAFWMASFDPTIAKSIVEAVRINNGIASASLDSQFEKLLFEPLRVAASSMTGPIAIILDALDECGSPTARTKLLRLFKEDFPRLPSQFRFLITSRTEQDLLKALSSQPHVCEITLHHASDDSRADVIQYIRHEMQAVFEREDMEIPVDWDENVVLLGRTADGLFIWASTAVKQVSVSYNPYKALEKLLSYCRSGDAGARSGTRFGLAELYDSVLSNSGIQWDDEESREDFSRVLGAILLGKDPLSITTIDGLLGLRAASSSRFLVARLQSLLEYSPGDPNAPVRLYHTSFFDYLTAPERTGKPWFVNIPLQREMFAAGCFDVMQSRLRFNICNIESSFLRNDDVKGISDIIKERIPSSLNYACRFWGEHLCESTESPDMLSRLETFAKRRLLYWLEVLSVTKQFRRRASRALFDATLWTAVVSSELSSFLWDAYRLVNVFSLPMSQSVPHIYLSALSLSRGESSVSDHYSIAHPIVPIRTFGSRPPSPCMKTFIGHTGAVQSVAFSPDGKRIASSSKDKTIRVWDAESGELVIDPLIGHEGAVLSVVFSSDGKLIASGSQDGTIRIWDAQTGEVRAGPYAGHTGPVNSVAFSPNNDRIASASGDATIRVWDVDSGELLVRPFGYRHYGIRSIAFSPDGDYIASGSTENTVRVWNAASGELAHGPFEGHVDWVNSVVYSPNGERIASGSLDGTVRVWDVMSGELAAGPFSDYGAYIYAVAFSPDGQRVASAFRTVRLWDVKTGELVTDPFRGHEDPINSIAFSLDGKRIVSGSEDGTVCVWDADRSGGPSMGHDAPVTFAASSPDGKFIATGSHDAVVCIWDGETGKLVAGPIQEHASAILAVVFSSDGKRIASISWDETVRIWDAMSGKLVAGPLEGHMQSSVFSPDSKRLVSASPDRTVRVWDTESGKLVAEPFTGHEGPIFSVAFSSDGEYVASGSYDATVRVWDATSGKTVAGPFEGHDTGVDSVAFSSNGKQLVAGSRGGKIYIWDIWSGVLITGPLEGHTDAVLSVAFSRDGQRVASGSDDGTVRVWDVKTGALVAGPFEEQSHQGLHTVSFLSNGRYVAACSLNGTFYSWDLEYDANCSALVAGYAANDGSTGGPYHGTRNPTPTKDPVNPTMSFLARLGISSNWPRSDDGWLLGKNGELVLWIPLDVRPTLWQPSNAAVYSWRFSTKLDLELCVLGDRWHKGCRGFQ